MRSGSFCWWGRALLQGWHDPTSESISSIKEGQYTVPLALLFVASIPGCPLWSCLRYSLRKVCGTFQDDSMVHDKLISDWKVRLYRWGYTLGLCWPAIRNKMDNFLHHRICKSVFLKFGHTNSSSTMVGKLLLRVVTSLSQQS